MSGKLKLKAVDAEDVEVLSAILQDALLPVCDMTYQSENKSFILAVQRLCREQQDGMKMERICCAVTVRGVETVQTKAFAHGDKGRVLDILAAVRDGDYLSFLCAGEAQMRLKLASGWSILVEDFGESWPAACSPCHDQAEVKGKA